jgi:hypothetical protein
MPEIIQTKRKGGRPPLPPAPQNAAECRELIARETVKTSPSERRLRLLYRLLKSFVAAEEAGRMDLQNRLQQEANALQAAELQRKRADYLLRMAKGPLAAKVISQQKERIADLEEQVRILTASKIGEDKPEIETAEKAALEVEVE